MEGQRDSEKKRYTINIREDSRLNPKFSSNRKFLASILVRRSKGESEPCLVWNKKNRIIKVDKRRINCMAYAYYVFVGDDFDPSREKIVNCCPKNNRRGKGNICVFPSHMKKVARGCSKRKTPDEVESVEPLPKRSRADEELDRFDVEPFIEEIEGVEDEAYLSDTESVGSELGDIIGSPIHIPSESTASEDVPLYYYIVENVRQHGGARNSGA